MGWLELEQPWLLWSLLLVLPALVVLQLRSRSQMSRRGQVVSLTLRALWALSSVVALASPLWVTRETTAVRARVVVLSDASASVATDASRVEAARQKLLRDLAGKADVTPVAFAGGTAEGAGPAPDPQETDIEAALRTADGEVLSSSNAHVVLITDGRATRGTGLDAARRLGMRGVAVHVVPAGVRTGSGVKIARVEPPVDARVGVPAGLRVTVDSGEARRGTVRLLRPNGEVVDQRSLTLSGQQTVMLHFTPREQGVEQYSVEVVEPAGRAVAAAAKPLDARLAPVSVQGPPRILVADAFREEIQALQKALEPLKIPVDVVHPGDWPENLGEYAAVVISDFSGTELTPPQRTALAGFVADGGGLVFLAGPNVVPARWKKNELAEVLPVVLKEKPAELIANKPQATVVFVIDRSGSMSGGLPSASGQSVSKLELVKAAVQASIAALPPDTQVAVVAFSGQPQVVVPLAPVSRKDEIFRLIDAIGAGGGTTMRPAIEEGLDILRQARGDKYIIALTDGICERRQDGAYWSVVTDAAKKMGASWTSIAVGKEADQVLLSTLAADAKGKYFYCDTADKIPQVFVQQAQQIRKTQEKKEQPFKPRPGPAVAWLKDVDVAAMPELRGRVKSTPRDQAEIVLVSDTDEPLLATWHYGLGRVAAYTSDAKGAWGKGWITWAGYSSFWQQVVQGVLRPPPALHVRVQFQQHGGRATWNFHVTDKEGRPPKGLKTDGNLLGFGAGAATSTPSPLEWRAVGPSSYQASVDVPPGDGQYLASVALTPEKGRGVKYVALLSGARVSEMAATGPDLPALAAIAEAGGGILTDDVDRIAQACAAQREETRNQRTPLWPWLIILALLMWPLDLAVRKWM